MGGPPNPTCLCADSPWLSVCPRTRPPCLQRITSLGSSLRSDSEACEAVMELVRRMLRNTETALYTFKRTYLWREGLKVCG